MKEPLSLALFTVAGFVLGNLLGNRIPPAGQASPIPAHKESAKDGSNEGPTRAAADNPEETHDLRGLIRWNLLQTDGGPELENAVGRMDGAAIRELMTGIVAARREEPLEIHRILKTAARELYRREGEKALEWADALDPAAGRMQILEQAIIAAAADSPEAAKPWIDRYIAEFGDLYRQFAAAAVMGATRRGAEDLLQLLKSHPELAGDGSPRGPLPDDFDFQLLISQSQNLSGMNQTMEYWTVKDRDAAWTGVKEIFNQNSGKGVVFFGSVFTGIAATEGEQNAARWISHKLDELPPDLRERAVSALLTNQLTQNVSYQTLMEEFPHDADRVALVASIINPFANPAAGSNGLRSLGSESLQVQALVRSAKTFSMAASDPGNPSAGSIHAYFGQTMDQLDLQPDAREKVNSILNTPQVPYPE